MSANASVQLQHFFLFNSTFGQNEEEEHKKILFFYPTETATDTQIRTVGLCEAVLKFTQTFNPSKSCEAMHTQKTKQFIYQPEEDYWMIMTVCVPVSAKDGQQDYHGDDLHDNVYLGVLKMSYLTFRFFQGTFQSIVTRSSVDVVRQKTNSFFSRYLLNLRLGQADLTDVFNGICFLPLDKITFLKVQCFVNLLEATFDQLKYSVFLYNEQLVWSGLGQEDMQILYRCLVSSLFPAFQELELQVAVPTAKYSLSQTHYGRFVVGPPNVNDANDLGRVPTVHLKLVAERCHLVVYKALSASVCLLIDSSFQLSVEFFKKLDGFLGPQLTNLASHIADVCSSKSNTTGSCQEHQLLKYVYFNRMNLAQKSTMHVGSKCSNVPVDVLRLLADVNADLERVKDIGEVFVKTMSGDYWAIGKMSDKRELYVFLGQKNTSLVEATDELNKMCASQFDNIFSSDY